MPNTRQQRALIAKKRKQEGICDDAEAEVQDSLAFSEKQQRSRNALPPSRETDTPPPALVSVREKMRFELRLASLRKIHFILPDEILRLIEDYTLCTKIQDLPDFAFDDYRLIENPDPNWERLNDDELEDAWAKVYLGNSIRKQQFQAVYDLDDNPIEPWGENIDDVARNSDLGILWRRVGFWLGWPNSGETIDFDVWCFLEYHHYHAPFVFHARDNQVLLRYGPVQLLSKETSKEHSKERISVLGKRIEAVMWREHENAYPP